MLHSDGSGDEIPLESLSELYGELRTADREHGDVAVFNDELGWMISAHRDGRVVLSEMDTTARSARHMIPVAEDRVLELWGRLIAGDLNRLLTEPWRPGYV